MALTISQGVRNLLAHWGTIQSAASSRLGVGGAWNAIRNALGQSEGQSVKGFASIQDMNAVYALAAGNRAAGEAFMGAAGDEAVTAAMIGSTPNARDALAQEAAPLYNVRVGYSWTESGETRSDFLTVQLPQSLEGFTVADLQGLVTTLAGVIATGYGRTTIDFTSYVISEA